MQPKKILNIGVLAHVDAGKTSLTEAMLFAAGATKTKGSVDDGSALTDHLELEKRRGISIKTSTVSFNWQETKVNLIDTPGHIDFAAEVDRALSVLDAVILVVSAVEGVQAHTLNIWNTINESDLPCLLFINKIDRDGANLEQLFKTIETDLQTQLFALNIVDDNDRENLQLIGIDKANDYVDEYIPEKSFENLADLDEEFLEKYLEGNLTYLNDIQEKFKMYFQSKQLTPLLFGSAKYNIGIMELLDQLIDLCDFHIVEERDFAARVFKVSYNAKLGRLAHMRVYSGNLRTKELVWSHQLKKEIKINQIYQPEVADLKQIDRVDSNDVAMISASELILPGDNLGLEISNQEFKKINPPVLSVQVFPEQDKDYQKLAEALQILNIEDPQLDFQWLKKEKEFHLKILGPIQTEVLKDSLLNRFGIASSFQSPKIIYKETPKSSAEGFVRYWMPKPCWAIMKFMVEPLSPGSGVHFESKVRYSDIAKKYQNEVELSIPLSLRQGIKGWEVTDIKITLLEGEDHTMHSNPGDFLLATPMGIMRALEHAETDLLEPMYAYEIKAHKDLLGALTSDLTRMKATINTPVFEGNSFVIKGKVSVEQAMDYGIKFNTTTSGKGRLKLSLDGYQKTNFAAEKMREYIGVSPLDEAQWILHKRGAFKADERLNSL